LPKRGIFRIRGALNLNRRFRRLLNPALRD
jgi:hypothetical protein